MWFPALMLALAVFWVFMLWDLRKRKKLAHAGLPPPRRRPRPIKRWPPVAALAGMFAFFTLVELWHPRQPPFTGRLGFVLEQVHHTLGAYGLAGIWLGVAAALALAARLTWRRDQARALFGQRER